MTRFAAAALMSGAVTLGSCSAEHLGAGRDGSADTSTRLDTLGADRCTASLSDLGARSATTIDGTAADLPACAGLAQTVKLCGGLIALGQGGGFTSLTCYYDAATHLLVGALELSDTPEFCGGESSARFDGQIPGPSCGGTAPSFTRNCSRDGSAG